jgi:hypothetical protein
LSRPPLNPAVQLSLQQQHRITTSRVHLKTNRVINLADCGVATTTGGMEFMIRQIGDKIFANDTDSATIRHHFVTCHR